MTAIEAQDLTKTYVASQKAPGIVGSLRSLVSRKKDYIQAVRSINLKIEQGELVGFLGPNGAGKTTTLKMLSGILHPTSGTAKVLDYDPTKRRPEMLRQISLVMGNKMQLWWDLPAWDGFLVLKELYEVPDHEFKTRVDFLIECLDLTGKVNTQVRRLSLGERMKCELIAALLHNPKVVFLDEPTIGLDVVSQKRIRDFLKDLHARENCTVLLTSHYMQDVQELCDRVVVIDHGTVIFEGKLEELTAKFSDTRKVKLRFSSNVQDVDLARYGKVQANADQEAVIEVPRAEIAVATAGLLGEFPVIDVGIQEVDIEDVIRDLFTESAAAQDKA